MPLERPASSRNHLNCSVSRFTCFYGQGWLASFSAGFGLGLLILFLAHFAIPEVLSLGFVIEAGYQLVLEGS